MANETIRVFSVEQDGYVETEIVHKTDAEWQQLLSAEQYHVLRQQGTERACSGPLEKNRDDGVYRCAGCGLDLYHSGAKYDSGSGWPSFYQPVASENIATSEDYSMMMARTELHCRRCGGHLGHLFTDGPPPTGQRHCINSLSLVFARLEK